MVRNLLVVLSVVFLWKCTPPTEEKAITEVRTGFDATVQHILDLQDRQATDSLFPYLRQKDPTYRYIAALAFASILDTLAIDSLAPLLRDPVEKVRVAAAYALGQTGHVRGEPFLLEAFERYDTAGIWKNANAAILEAVGRCGTAESLDLLTGITTYQPKDTALLEGQAWGIYRFALRNITSPKGTELMANRATQAQYPVSVRRIAANYLYRARNTNLEPFSIPLAQTLQREDDEYIRMNLAVALGKTQSDTARSALLNQYLLETDYRVKCNILRACANFPYTRVARTTWLAVDDPNYHIARTAAQYFVDKGIPDESKTYWAKAKDTLHWEVQVLLYAAALKHTPDFQVQTKGAINNELKFRFEASQNPYEKAAILRTLAVFGWNYKYIKEKGYASSDKVVQVAAVEALAEIVNLPDFRTYFGQGYRKVRQDISNYCVEAFINGDPGMVATAAGILRTEGLYFEGTLDSLAVMAIRQQLNKLKIPQEIETYNEVVKTLAYLDKKDTYILKKPDYNHPVDWKLFETIPTGIQAIIKTSRGNITLELLPDLAPGTVVNFYTLAKSGFFSNKTFHRVVSNFVVQGGCPRGDGYGGPEYSIRSELPPVRYDREGMVGMASSGKHTEGVQFFITHAPAHHLDGNYTIFARVAEGMDLVHQLQIGDLIQEIEIINQ